MARRCRCCRSRSPRRTPDHDRRISEGIARRAARLGLPLYMNGNPPGIKELYEELCAENGTVPFCIAPKRRRSCSSPKTPTAPGPNWASTSCSRPHLRRLAARGSELAGALHAMTVDDLREEGIFLTPIRPRVRRRCGVRTLHPLVGGMPIDEAWRSVELFADAVLSGDARPTGTISPPGEAASATISSGGSCGTNGPRPVWVNSASPTRVSGSWPGVSPGWVTRPIPLRLP